MDEADVQLRENGDRVILSAPNDDGKWIYAEVELAGAFARCRMCRPRHCRASRSFLQSYLFCAT
jgi:hypothetical protein